MNAKIDPASQRSESSDGGSEAGSDEVNHWHLLLNKNKLV